MFATHTIQLIGKSKAFFDELTKKFYSICKYKDLTYFIFFWNSINELFLNRRKLYQKYRDPGGSAAQVNREDTGQTSLKSQHAGSRKSSRGSRVTKDPNSRDNLLPQVMYILNLGALSCMMLNS